MRGIAVTLFDKQADGIDEFNRSEYEEVPVTVDNVIVAPASSTDVLSTTQLYGKKAVYQLFIPKGDTNEWKDRKVAFRVGNVDFVGHTFGFPDGFIDDMVPLEWNMRVWVEEYE